MTHGSVLLTPRVFLNRDQPYSAIKPMTIGTSGGTVTQSFTVPFDVFCYGLQFSIYGQDLDGNTYAITELDPSRDKFTVQVVVTGKPDFATTEQDHFAFNHMMLSTGFEGLILPRNTDITITATHVYNGNNVVEPPFFVEFEAQGYQLLGVEDVKVTGFNPRR